MLDQYSSGRRTALSTSTAEVLLHHCRAKHRTAPQGLLAGVKTPELRDVTRRFYIPDSCLPTILPVTHHALLWQLSKQSSCSQEYIETRIMWIILVLSQHPHPWTVGSRLL